jgi:hypothetical protein
MVLAHRASHLPKICIRFYKSLINFKAYVHSGVSFEIVNFLSKVANSGVLLVMHHLYKDQHIVLKRKYS